MRTKKGTGRLPEKGAAFYEERRQELAKQKESFLSRAKPQPDFRNMRPGAARREVLLAWLRDGLATGERRVVYVNRRHCLQLHQDRDLQLLLKKGVLRQRRQNAGFSPSLGARAGSFCTYLELA